MAILLSWKNSNTTEVTIKIYRSTSPLDTSALPAALVTLPGDARTYTDETATGNVNYYYVVEATNGTIRIFAKSPSIINVKSRGPGPSILQQGDYDCGYFGEVLASELPIVTDAFNINPSYITAVRMLPQKFHKFAWKGRILYLGEFSIGQTSSPTARSDQLKYLRSGLVYNFTSAELAAQIPNIVSKNKFSFHARSIRATPDDWDGVSNSYDLVNMNNPDTEFNQLACSLMQSSPFIKRKLSGIKVSQCSGTLCPIMIADPGNKNGTAAAATYPVLRFSNSGNNHQTSATFSGPRTYGFSSNQFVDYGFLTGFQSQYYVSSGIWPVFELIES